MSEIKCAYCEKTKGMRDHHFKRGWSNCWYCSEQCERNGLKRLFESMPGGPLPGGRLPYDISREVSERWSDEQ